MSNFKNDLVNILEMLQNIEIDLNLVGYSETEKKVYYTIALRLSKSGSCNISNVIETSGYSRSTVYKTIKKFELDNLIKLKQSHVDKREFNLSLSLS
jgi:DNA-binding MarR family transcriptional regulator